MDILTDLAAPLPAWVSSEILGVPAEDRNELTQLSYRLFRIFDQPMSLKGYQDMNQAALEFKDYFRALIARKEKQPRYDLIDKLIAVRDEGSKLSEEELLSFCAMLFSVGQETTENLIGNGVLALLNHPEQMAKLRDNPQFIQSTVEELLRYDNPVQIIARVTKKDIKIGGKTIRAGERIYFALGAANRDPDVFPNPDQLDITRQGTQNLPFGYGIHFCLGAALARIQGQVAINTVVRRLSDLKRSTNVLEWRENIVLRGLKALPVSFSVRG
jgi:cytochrome P450